MSALAGIHKGPVVQASSTDQQLIQKADPKFGPSSPAHVGGRKLGPWGRPRWLHGKQLAVRKITNPSMYENQKHDTKHYSVSSNTP